MAEGQELSKPCGDSGGSGPTPLSWAAAIRSRALTLAPLLLGLLGVLLAGQVGPHTWRSETEVSFDLPGLSVDPTILAFPDTGYFLEQQVKLARSRQLAIRVVRAAQVPGLTAAQFLRHSSARPHSTEESPATADVLDAPPPTLDLLVTYRRRTSAVRLANAYASQFSRYSKERYVREVQGVLRRLDARIKRVVAGRASGTGAYQALVSQRAEVKELLKRSAITMSVLRTKDASAVRRHALRNAILGGVVGVALGVALMRGLAARRRRSA
jgi:hypothetical protein